MEKIRCLCHFLKVIALKNWKRNYRGLYEKQLGFFWMAINLQIFSAPKQRPLFEAALKEIEYNKSQINGVHDLYLLAIFALCISAAVKHEEPKGKNRK